MRRNAVLAALCLAPPALAAPVPIVLIQGLEAVAGAAHPPAPVAPGARNPPSLGDPEDSTAMLVIDNRPLTPSPTVNPSIVLASVKPIETTYLLGLASATATATTKPAPPKEKEDVVVLKDGSEIPKDLLTAVRSSTIAQMEIGMEETATKTTMPCIYSQLSREYHDMLVISLVVAFLLVVVAVEMWETVRNSARRVFSGQGAIRLEISGSSPPQQPLSIQSDAPTSEKPRL